MLKISLWFSDLLGVSGKWRVQKGDHRIHLINFSVPTKVLPIHHTCLPFFIIFFLLLSITAIMVVSADLSSKLIFLNNEKNFMEKEFSWYFVHTLLILCLYFVFTLYILSLYFRYTFFILSLYFLYSLFILSLYFLYTFFILSLYFVRSELSFKSDSHLPKKIFYLLQW